MKKSDYSGTKSAKGMSASIAEDANGIIAVINSRDIEDLPTWWTNKLAICYAYINSLRDYAVYRLEEDGMYNEEEYEETEKEDTSDSQKSQVVFNNYTTKHFDICPSAVKLYSTIVEKTDMIHLVLESVMLHDIFFKLEKQAIAMGSIDQEMLDKAQHYANMIMSLAREMDLEEEHAYINDIHMQKFKDLMTVSTVSDDMMPPSARMMKNAD